MMKKAGLGGAIFLFICAAAPAQDTQPVKDTASRPLQEVVVTALRTESAPVQVPYTISRITAQQLEEGNPRTTPEALMMMNAVFVQKTNHGGGSPFVRGLTGNQVLLLVDGIRLNNATYRYGPNQYLNTVDAYTIGAIEVARGTGSVQYGTDALGGVMHVLTKEPRFSEEGKKWKGHLLAKYVTRGMEKTGRNEWEFTSKNLALLGGISLRDFGNLYGGDTTGRQAPSGYTEMATDFKMKIRLSGNWQLVLAHQWVKQAGVPLYHKMKLENFAVSEMNPQRRLLDYIRLKGVSASRIFRQTEITASWQQSREVRNSRKRGSNILRREEDRVGTMGLTMDIFSQFAKNWSANSGVEFYRDHIASSREDLDLASNQAVSSRGLYPDQSVYGNASLFTLQHFRLGKWMAEAGARFNVFDIKIQDTTLGKVQLNPAAFVANAALLYQLAEGHSIYASVSNGYRAPNIDDMGSLGIVDFRYEIPAAGLRPEGSLHTEIGYKFSKRKLSGSVNLFRMQLHQMITRVKMEGQVISGYPVYRKENSETARLKGMEAEIKWQFLRHWSVYGGANYTRGQNISRNEPLRRVPPFNGRILGTYRKHRFFLKTEWQFASRQDRLAQGDKDDNRIPAGGTPGWHVMNVFTGYSLPSVQLTTGLQNIFNADYRTHGSGINGAGRSVFINAVFSF